MVTGRYQAQWNEDGQRFTVGVTMKKVAWTVLRKTVVNTMMVIVFAGLLSGCAVVGPLLSMGSMAGFAPLQYASSAYTVGEFAYEFAANDRDPGELIQHKIDSVLNGEAFELPDYLVPDDDEIVMVAAADTSTSSLVPAEADISADARQKRIENLLGQRKVQFERLELRRMEFLQAKADGDLSLRQTAMVTRPDLFQGAKDEVSLD